MIWEILVEISRNLVRNLSVSELKTALSRDLFFCNLPRWDYTRWVHYWNSFTTRTVLKNIYMYIHTYIYVCIYICIYINPSLHGCRVLTSLHKHVTMSKYQTSPHSIFCHFQFHVFTAATHNNNNRTQLLFFQSLLFLHLSPTEVARRNTRSETNLSGGISWTCYQAICGINWKTSKQNTKQKDPPKRNLNHLWIIRESLPIVFTIFFHFLSDMKVELIATRESLTNKLLTFTKTQYLCSFCTGILFFLCKRWLHRFLVSIN